MLSFGWRAGGRGEASNAGPQGRALVTLRDHASVIFFHCFQCKCQCMQHERPSSSPTLGPTLASHRPYRRSTSGAMVGAFVCTVGTMHRNALAGADLLLYRISVCLKGIQMGVRWGSKVELVTKRGIQGVPTVQEIKGSRWGSAGDPGGILAQNGGSRGCRLCKQWGIL